MLENPQLSVAPSAATTSISGSAKRRSTRIPRRSEEAVSNSDIGIAMGDHDSAKDVDQTNSVGSSPTPREGWKHPAELKYIRRSDWSQDLIITYLCQKAFTVPPRQTNTTLSYIEITRSLGGEKIQVPRGYRIPLIFVAKFQWDSLRLVLNSASEWEEYKFDIVHLSRLCTHFFKQAKAAASENKLSKAWRSPMFDRALIRFYRKWMVSREWSVKKFWEEFDEDEYTLDVLKFDWSRWVLKGHKGFALTKEEVQNGVTAAQYRQGLKRRPDGTWMWGGDDSTAQDVASLDVLSSLASQDAVEAITNATSSPDSLEAKRELLEMENEDGDLNKNGKRRRGDGGDTPGKLPRSLKKPRTPRKVSKEKAAASTLPSFGSGSLPAGDKRLGNRHEKDTAMDKDSASQPSTSAPITPRKQYARMLPRRGGNPTPPSPASTSTRDPPSLDKPYMYGYRIPYVMARRRVVPILSRNPNYMANSLSDPESSTDDPESSTMKDLPMTSTQLEDTTVLPTENTDEEISHQSPLVTDAETLGPTNLWPPKALDILAPALSIIGSSSPATGNSQISNGGQEGKLISETTGPSGPSLQADVAHPEIVPNTEKPDLLTPQPMGGSKLNLRSDTSVLPESSSVYSSPLIDKLIMSSLSSPSSSYPLAPDVHLGAPIPDLPPSLPSDRADISNGFNRPVDLGSGSRDPTSPCFQQLKAKFIQDILDTVRKMATVTQIEEQQAEAGSGSMRAEGRDMVQNSTGTPLLSRVLSANLASVVDGVKTIVETQSVIEKVHAEVNGAGGEVTKDLATIVPADSGDVVNGETKGDEENGTRSEVTNGKDLTIIFPADSGDAVNGEMKEDEGNGTRSEVTNGKDLTTIVPADSGDAVNGEMKEDEKEREMVDEAEVVDTMSDLVDGTNGTDVRMESCAVETQPIQSHQETPTVDNMDGVNIAMEKDAVEVQPVQSSQETLENKTARMGIALEVPAGEGQSLDSQSLTIPSAHINDSKSTHHSMECVPSPVELEGGDSREGENADAGDLEDKMDVDEEMVQPIQPTPPADKNLPKDTLFMTGEMVQPIQPTPPTDKNLPKDTPFMTGEMVQPIQPTPPTDKNLPKDTLFMITVARTKSLHSIRILRDLMRFLRMPARDQQVEMSGTLNDNLAGPRLSMEEALNVDQRLDVLAYVSLTLAKNLYPYRGKELETKIDLLDKHLRQQFEMIQKPDGRSCGDTGEPFKEFDPRVDTAFDRNTQTVSQAVQTSLPHVDRQFETVEVQTEAEDKVSSPQQSLSIDTTMVDPTLPTPPLQETPSTPAAPGEAQPDNASAITQTVMSMMRNMADLLECTTQGTGSVRSLKGKEKEVNDANMVPSYLNSPVLTTILEEFKLMKEDMRRSQHRSQSEVESLRLSHYMEVETLKNEIRNIEGRGKQELDRVTRQYSQQIGELKATIRLREDRERTRDREKEGGPGKLLPLDLRRVASLEARSRSDSDMLRSASRSSMTNGHFVEPAMGRPPNFNPPHLIPTEFEDQPYPTSFRGPRQFIREGSMSKPGTPVSTSDRNPFSNRHPDVMDLDESMPLPAKSQRKMYMMNFPRPPMG